MHNRLDNIKQIFKNTKDPNSIRSTKIEALKKSALGDQHGAFQHFQSNVMEYATRDRYLSMRGGEPIKRDTEGLYGIGPEHEDSYMPDSEPAWHLSTRYSPDRVGVQAQRVSDGVFQDPYTNKVYDYNEGFKTEDGRQFPAGSASLQTSIMHLANHLDNKGLVKEANYLDNIIKEAFNPVFTSAVPVIFAWLVIESGALDPAVEAVWQRIPQNTRTALKAIGSAIRALPAGMAEDLKAGLRASINKALELIDVEPLEQREPVEHRKIEEQSAEILEDLEGRLEATRALVAEWTASDGYVDAAELTNSVIKLACHLDNQGLVREANYLDALLKKNAQDDPFAVFETDSKLTGEQVQALPSELRSLADQSKVSEKLEDHEGRITELESLAQREHG